MTVARLAKRLKLSGDISYSSAFKIYNEYSDTEDMVAHFNSMDAEEQKKHQEEMSHELMMRENAISLALDWVTLNPDTVDVPYVPDNT